MGVWNREAQSGSQESNVRFGPKGQRHRLGVSLHINRDIMKEKADLDTLFSVSNTKRHPLFLFILLYSYTATGSLLIAK